MKYYIRTKDGRIINFELKNETEYEDEFVLYNALVSKAGKEHFEIERVADTIEDLCDVFVVYDNYDFAIFNNLKLARQTKGTCYGAIRTDKGLIYIAKMNEEGVLCLI